MGILNILIDNIKVKSGQDTDNFISSVITGRADISNAVKAGSVDITNDTAQTFTFDEAFTGNDADIYVVLTRNNAGITAAIPVTAATLTGFTVDRNDSVDGTNAATYVAINMGALKSIPVYG